eukprot:10616724-Ditylum_brightwellii.AAC.1
MDTKIEDSNLANIGSAEDKAAKKAAAEGDPMWKDAEFGINHWPKKYYGQFYRGTFVIYLAE